VYIFSVESLSKFLFCSLAYGNHFTGEVESLACHSVVEVHLHRVRCHFENNARDYATHAVHHRNCVSWYEEVFTDLSVHFKCSLRKVDDSVWIHFSISVCR
jgi:hypothetical protein